MPEITLTEPVGPDGSPLVVLAHSLGTGPLIWEQVAPPLSADYRISLLTLPGHANTAIPPNAFTMADLADAVARKVRLIQPSDVLFAGVSISGALALQLSLQHPSLFRGVAAIATGASLGDAAHWRGRAELVRSQSTSVLIANSSKQWFAPGSIAAQPDLSGRILHALQETSTEGYARCAEALGTYNLRDNLSQISVPVLAMGGQFDTVAPPRFLEEIAVNVPDARAVEIPDAAHQPPAEQPVLVTDHLRKFLAEVSQ